MAEELLIIKIEAFAYTIPAKPTTISLGTLYEAKNFLVKIYTNKGIAGWGEGAPFPMIVGETQETCMALSKDFASLLLGKDSLLIDERMRQLTEYAPFNFTCKSAFDMALHDVAAQYANKPLYKFLGGEKKELLTDETIYIESPERMAGSALKIAAKNPFFIKVKLGKDNNAPHDVEIVQTIRRAIGNTIPLRLDANQGWSVDNAVTVLTALADANVEFCEQPVHKHDIQGLKKITQSSPIKIMADEACFTAHDAQQLIEQQACDYINIKLAKTGSMVEAGAIAKLAALHNMKCMLGGMDESALALTANAHFACAHDSIVFHDMDYNINHL
ncbi:MAG: dipeptide epimerase, partial [Parafilimonas sp.]